MNPTESTTAAAPQSVWDGIRGDIGPCSAAVHAIPDPRDTRPHKWSVWTNVNNAYIGEGSCKTVAEARATCEAVARVYLKFHPESQPRSAR